MVVLNNSIPSTIYFLLFRSSESENESHEDEWEPPKKAAGKSKMPKPKVPRVKKANATQKKPVVARKRTRKVAVKEEPVSKHFID